MKGRGNMKFDALLQFFDDNRMGSKGTLCVIRKCVRNLEDGKRPILITTYRRATVAEGLADSAGVADRIDVFDIEQFIAGNLFELGKFSREGRSVTAAKLVGAYNQIVEDCETDPSLKIILGSR